MCLAASSLLIRWPLQTCIGIRLWFAARLFILLHPPALSTHTPSQHGRDNRTAPCTPFPSCVKTSWPFLLVPKLNKTPQSMQVIRPYITCFCRCVLIEASHLFCSNLLCSVNGYSQSHAAQSSPDGTNIFTGMDHLYIVHTLLSYLRYRHFEQNNLWHVENM